MEMEILDYFDFKKANTLLEGFNQLTNIATSILDFNGNVLAKSGWKEICTEFHRKNPKSFANCKISDTVLGSNIKIGEKYHFYSCLNGMTDVSAPIVIRGKHVANFYLGQFLMAEPDISFFKKQAQKHGFEEKAYLEALKKVPVVSQEKVEEAMKFLIEIIEIIIEMTVEKLEQTELNERIKKNEAALLESQILLKENMDDLLESQRIARLGTWRFNLATNQMMMSEELYKIFDFDPTRPLPSSTAYQKRFTSESWDKLLIAFEQTKISGVPFELELETVKRDGSNGWLWVWGEAVKDLNGSIIAKRGVAQNITERIKTEEKMAHLSYYDQLTNLYNRRFYEEELKRMDTERNLPITLIMLDVDGLKITNDAFGHQAGDVLLQKVAKILKKGSRAGEVISRIGGDEFVILMPKCNATQARLFVDGINKDILKEKETNPILSLSIGYATKETLSQEMNAIFKEAEDNMYRHKISESLSMRSKSIDLIMNSLFEKSNRERHHSDRVGKISESIAAYMNFSQEDIQQIKVAGFLHDIGKIGISDSILNKEGKLDNDEWEEMKKHSEIGYRILSPIHEFSEISEYVLSHQEKWDGKGYPQKLKQEEIPIQARIIAVADSFDAMTEERSYRNVMSEREAVDEIRRCAGTQFDPEVARIFVEKVMKLSW